MLWTRKALPGTAVTSIMIDKQIHEKPTEIQTISTSQLALWFERFAPDQENMSLTNRCSGTDRTWCEDKLIQWFKDKRWRHKELKDRVG